MQLFEYLPFLRNLNKTKKYSFIKRDTNRQL
jgi:hypothetical protein